MDTRTTQTDPVELIESLSSVEIAQRLDTLAAQEAALRSLLRVARLRERGADKARHDRGEGAKWQ